MQTSQSFTHKINLFMNFIQVNDSIVLEQKVRTFFEDTDMDAQKNIIFDHGQLMMISDGKLVDEVTASTINPGDRIVSFDGNRITEINPYSYLHDHTLKMKGDSDGRRKRNSSDSSSEFGISSNNNNNNNNNNNG